MAKKPTIEAMRADRMDAASRFKQQTYFALEDIIGGRAVARFFGILLFFLIVANAVLVFILVQFHFSMNPGVSAFYAVSTLCFAVEYAFRLWIADIVYPQYPPFRSRIRYILSGYGIIDLLAFLPNMIAWFFPLTNAIMNTINILRLIRLIKLSRYMRGLRTINRVVMKSRSEIIAAFLVIALLIVVASILMYEVENPAQPEMWDSLFTGIYWAVTTITTTGYGDVVPVTGLGRLLASITMLLALAIIAVPSGIISAGFVAEYQSIEKRRRGSRHGHEHDDGDDETDEYFDDTVRSVKSGVDRLKGDVLSMAEAYEGTSGADGARHCYAPDAPDENPDFVPADESDGEQPGPDGTEPPAATASTERT